MAEGKHTSGPWLASNRTMRTHNHPERFWERHVHTAERLELVGTGSGANPEEAEANAAVFAAAPDMLAALKAITDPAYGNPSEPDATRRVDALATAAIAKAEGR